MSNRLVEWTLNCRLPRGSKQKGIICQLIFCLFLCGCARQNAGRWHGLAFYAERHAFTEIVGCQEEGLKGGLDRWIRLCEFCMVLMSNKLAGWTLNCRLPRGSKQKCIICQLIFCLFLCGCARQNAGRWRSLVFYAERQAFMEIVGCQEVGLKGGLDRSTTLCKFCMILTSNKLAGRALNCRLPRGGSERGACQVD